MATLSKGIATAKPTASSWAPPPSASRPRNLPPGKRPRGLAPRRWAISEAFIGRIQPWQVPLQVRCRFWHGRRIRQREHDRAARHRLSTFRTQPGRGLVQQPCFLHWTCARRLNCRSTQARRNHWLKTVSKPKRRESRITRERSWQHHPRRYNPPLVLQIKPWFMIQTREGWYDQQICCLSNIPSRWFSPLHSNEQAPRRRKELLRGLDRIWLRVPWVAPKLMAQLPLSYQKLKPRTSQHRSHQSDRFSQVHPERRLRRMGHGWTSKRLLLGQL